MLAADEDFEATVLPALDALHNLARRLERHPHGAEDLAQEALTRAWRAWCSGVRPERPGPWLATICLNLSRDRARRGCREVTTAEQPDLPASVDVAEEAIDRLRASRVEQALRELPEDQRVAITLMDICGLTAAETAEVVGAPRGTVLARVHRGRRALARAVTGTDLPTLKERNDS